MKQISELSVPSGTKTFCVKFDSMQAQILYSGGWDKNVRIWDCRSGFSPVGMIGGPFICGEGIDIDSQNFQLLTASHVVEPGIQLWDIRTLAEIKSIIWSPNLPKIE